MRPYGPVLQRHTGLINRPRLRELIGGVAIDVLVCRGGVNVSYLSGIASPGTLGRHLDLADSPREVYVVWPAGGEPSAIVSDIASGLARSTGWIDDLRIYPDYVESPERVLAGFIAERGFANGRIGVDLAWFGARRWEDLRRLLPRAEFVDVTDGLDVVRAVKTDEEIVLLREAARMLDRAFADALSELRVGVTERQAHATLVRKAIELGAESIHGILQASSNRVLYGGEGDIRIEPGDIVRTDYVAYARGESANLSRIWCAGRPSKETRTRYASYLEIYKDAVALLHAGAQGSAIHAAIQVLFTSRGWEAGPPISGHGIGAWFHQQRPLLVPESTDVLEPGMVIALEPISGHWHLQDEYLITDGDPVRISDGFELEELPWLA